MKKGYDYFTPDAGTIKMMTCKVCGMVCDVERGVVGPRSFAGAMAGIKTKHDSFSCSHSEKEWHKNALVLYEDIKKCNSPSLKNIMRKDLRKMVRKGKV